MILDATWRYVVAAGAAALATAVLIHGVPAASASGAIGAAARVGGGSLLFTALYVCAVGTIHGGWDPVRHVARIARDMVLVRTAARGATR